MSSSSTTIRTVGIYIPVLTGSLSVLGSSAIIYSIWARRETKLKDPQHRILGMMSIFDVCYSINKALVFLTYPSGLGVPTLGNVATCSLQGFFTQFGYAAGTYNLVLSLYFYLTINRGMKKKDFARVLEKVLHSTVISLHLGFAITGVSIGLFNPTPSFCYIAPGPYGCQDDPDVECRFANTAPYFYEAFAQFWIQLAYIVIIVTNLLIWLYVRKQENSMRKYRVSLQSQTANDERLDKMKQETSYARSVFIQSILYVGAFFLSWSWTTIYHLVAWFGGVSVPWITLLINTFLPLQGFWNAFIYARPRYLRVRKTKENLAWFEILKLVFLPPNNNEGQEEERIQHNGNCSSAPETKPEEDGRASGIFKSFQASLNRYKGRKSSITESLVAVVNEKGTEAEEEGGITNEV